jgi:hypothetical protein
MLPSSCLTKEGIKGCILMFCLSIFHLILFTVKNNTIWLDSMFQAVEFPTSITNLDTSLTNVNGKALPLK